MSWGPGLLVRWRSAIALAVLVMLAVGLGQTGPGRSVLRKAGLLGGPASYTSLAFLHPQSLNEQLGSKRADVAVSFVIHNAGGVPQDYRWAVLLAQGQRTRSIGSGSVRVGSGRAAAITRPAKIFCTRGRVRIAVNLARPAEWIDAWLTCWHRGVTP